MGTKCKDDIGIGIGKGKDYGTVQFRGVCEGCFYTPRQDVLNAGFFFLHSEQVYGSCEMITVYSPHTHILGTITHKGVSLTDVMLKVATSR